MLYKVKVFCLFSDYQCNVYLTTDKGHWLCQSDKFHYVGKIMPQVEKCKREHLKKTASLSRIKDLINSKSHQVEVSSFSLNIIHRDLLFVAQIQYRS